jgi:transposase
MQGKEASEQETRQKCTAGIDTCKEWLDAHVLPHAKLLRVPNTPAGIKQLKRWLMQFEPELIAVEATSKWHRLLCRSLHGSGLAIAVTDPFRVRHFALAHGILDKTDKLDARVLALFAQLMVPPARPPAPESLEALKELVTGRDSAVAEQTSLENQLAAAQSDFLKHQLKRRIKTLAANIKAIERECLKRIKADKAMAGRFAVLTSIPGIGPITAIALIAQLSELGALTNKQIAKLAGLAPLADDSGDREGTRHIRGGRSLVRRMLYLAALAAVRSNPAMKAFYQRLRDKNKAAKIVLVAVARKLLLLANNLVAQNRLWQPIAPNHA